MFPAYWLYRYPYEWVGLTSYTASLATTLSRASRANYAHFGGAGALADDSKGVMHWETAQRGGMWCAGFGGSLLGRGMHVGIIDDPIKSSVEAQSIKIAERNLDFWKSTWTTRLEPDAAIVVVLQRWPGVADIVSQLFELEQGDAPERWHVVCLEGEKEAEPLQIPPTCTIEPDFRTQVGEPLCPERLSVARMAQMKSRSPFYFAAQVQQRPVPRDASMFPRDKVKVVAEVPTKKNMKRVRFWDKASTEGGGKYTAGCLMSYDKEDGIFYVEHMARSQKDTLERRKLMRSTAEMDGREVDIYVEQEPGSSGVDSVRDDVRNLNGFTIKPDKVTGDKVTRAEPFASQWQMGNVRIVAGTWNKNYLDEMELFPNGSYSDQVDASSGACNKLSRSGVWVA